MSHSEANTRFPAECVQAFNVPLGVFAGHVNAGTSGVPCKKLGKDPAGIVVRASVIRNELPTLRIIGRKPLERIARDEVTPMPGRHDGRAFVRNHHERKLQIHEANSGSITNFAGPAGKGVALCGSHAELNIHIQSAHASEGERQRLLVARLFARYFRTRSAV